MTCDAIAQTPPGLLGGDICAAPRREPGDDANTEAFGYMKLAAFPDGAGWGYFGLEGLEQVKAMGGLVIVDRRARLLVEAVPVL